MKKTILKSAVLCASIFGLALSANAAVINLNLTGASAEYTFWSAAAGPFLTSLGCTDVKSAKTGKQGITMGTCNSGADTVYVRYASKASYDGIESQKGLDPFNLTSCTDKSQREFADENQTDFAAGTVNGTTCQQVTLGASDVAASTFNQASSGALYGPLGGDQYAPSFHDLDASGLTSYNPIVVPFSFFKTTDVPANNMTRLMATQIFGGQVANWSAFNTAWNIPIVACLRHAGSGTHATLDAAVFRGEANMSTKEDTLGLFGPITYFNLGSGDLIKCLEWAHTNGYGGVGYSDVDKVLDANGQIITDPANAVNGVMQMPYNGEQAYKRNIVNGVYSFWSAQWIYEDPCETMGPNAPSSCTAGGDIHGVAANGALHTYIVDMMNFASDPANIALSGKGDFWAAQGEMKINKASDWAWPSR
ncbi:hypothetical protein ACOHYD_12240 [Desulfobacterota bacterium M19]